MRLLSAAHELRSVDVGGEVLRIDVWSFHAVVAVSYQSYAEACQGPAILLVVCPTSYILFTSTFHVPFLISA